MSTNCFSSIESFQAQWTSNQKYFDMLGMMASLSRLFSESEVPYLDYRLAENLFCKYYNAQNDARACTAYDARISKLGIGIKTFILKNECSTEKIAEFNKLKPDLDLLQGLDLARQLGIYRNKRMEVSNTGYGIQQSIYHIVGREPNLLKIFNVPYDFVNLDKIKVTSENTSSIHFHDGLNEYSFNKSKSVLMKKFFTPQQRVEKHIEILEDPLSILESFLLNKPVESQVYHNIRGYDYVVLPLYSEKDNEVPQKSGLNQWNAKGRERDENEIYIPIPAKLRHKYPEFFPRRDIQFELLLPDGSALIAKICQDGGKALMSNPNSALGKWLLRKVMQIKPGELVTMRDLEIFGFNSIVVYNLHHINPENGLDQYSIQFGQIQEDYRFFIEQ